ncbi:rRNA-processing protein UTP11 [Aspergillus homomorphus CBS 101889]|uniref:U3 small nucleolar RNA-associated protein 11 n=1 Tax=Aspergillus homomorphus (strain CBS 101889) TaxID=1450537 RepID=A0A395I8U3_ASPHC|nr:hypothetical protein BO97DRAFT_439632 [Aspergillus homomorphus CBS 101889]RAL16652.1 hypothetical protein BO97DRAFT_439632 [Aspergillus homomorphus CBS 101889]
MSTMRNAVQRRNHRERGQLQGREKWGILEKHKDYSLRAKDYNAKKAKLKRLQEKVRDRNPDEFNFGMMSSHSARQGRHGAGVRDSAEARGLGHDAIKLLKTQDAGYLRTVGERIRRQLEKLEEEVKVQEGIKEALGEKDEKKKVKKDNDGGFDDDMDFDFDSEDEEDEDDAGSGRKSRKVVFADDRDEQKELKRERELRLEDEDDDDEDDDEDDDSFGQRKKQQQKKSRKQIEAERLALVEARRARKMKKRAIEARENKIKALQKQYKEITAAERELDWQRGRMDNVVGGTNKNGVKWKIRERKR